MVGSCRPRPHAFLTSLLHREYSTYSPWNYPSHPSSIFSSCTFYILNLLLISPPAPPSKSSSSSCNSSTSSYKFSSPSPYFLQLLRLDPETGPSILQLPALYPPAAPLTSPASFAGCQLMAVTRLEAATSQKSIQLSGYSCQDTATRIQLPGPSCQDPAVRTQLSGHSCQGTAVRIQLSGPSCQDTAVRAQLAGYSCQEQYVRTKLSGHSCQGTPVRIQLSGPICQD